MPALLAAALLALLVGLPAPARADDPAPSSGSGYHPADKNRDGEVTRREARLYNRSQKRAGADGTDDGSGSPDDAQNDAATASAGAHSASAGKSAAAAASAMKSAFPSGDPGAGLKPAGGGAMGGAMGGAAGKGGGSPLGGGPSGTGASVPGSQASGNPADPKTPADFVLAAHSGYAPALGAAGLKLGPDGRTLIRADGSPATAEDYARLRSGILSMPAALSRRPDFFAQVSPQHYSDLKRGYHEDPQLSGSVYKHVGTTDGDRDFVLTASCAKMSGDCNASVDKASYKKGDFVAPDDLDRMWGALQKELDDAANPDGSASRPSGGMKMPKVNLPVDTSFDDGKAAGEMKTVAFGGTTVSAAGASTPAPVLAATQTAKRLWRATTVALGFGPEDKNGGASHGLAFAGLGAAALLGLGLAFRGRS